tara:strand:+ start:1073 stop:1249 length:177 start_codon:yes stop_codon:yes gene_type:complete
MKYIMDWIYGEDKKECCECEKDDCKCECKTCNPPKKSVRFYVPFEEKDKTAFDGTVHK